MAPGSLPGRQTGFLIKRGISEPCAKRLLQLAAEPVTGEQLGTPAAIRARRFSIERMVDDLYMLYHAYSGTDQSLEQGCENSIST